MANQKGTLKTIFPIHTKLFFFFFFFFFFNIFGGHIHMSYFGATDTPVLDFW